MSNNTNIDFGSELNNHKVEFLLYPINWRKFKNLKSINIRKAHWKETKYLNDSGKDLNTNVNKINNRTGGIYIFVIKTGILPSISEYLVYIGRAQYTTNHNLRVRVKKYYKEYMNDNERPKIVRMMTSWGNNLYLKYVEIDDNDVITKLEARLINTLLPPFNDEIPDKKIRKAIKAFK
ncbi:MAG TPA: hypothetical protein PKX68_07260 [Ignavibacteriaceae bacterium]|nr:hypothetical protein [Ignavibacteriaceae bacterium]